MADSHLTDQDIADRLAGGAASAPMDEAVEQHVAACAACRTRIDRAGAMLDIAASFAESDDVVEPCPDALQLAAYADRRANPDEIRTTEQHIAACSLCREVVDLAVDSDSEATRGVGGGGGGSNRTMRLWLSGATLFAVAAVVAVFVFFPRSPLKRMNVDVLAMGATRTASNDASASEFELRVTLRKPAWITLLVVDAQGTMTYLAERHVDGEFTFGRYAVQSPGDEAGNAVRRYVVVLVSSTSLADRLTIVDVDPVMLTNDATSDERALTSLCSKLSHQLQCEARFAPIRPMPPEN